MGTTGENDVTQTGTGSEGAGTRASETLHTGSSVQEVGELEKNGAEGSRRGSKEDGDPDDYPDEDRSSPDEDRRSHQDNDTASTGSGRGSSQSGRDRDDDQDEYGEDKVDPSDVRSKEDDRRMSRDQRAIGKEGSLDPEVASTTSEGATSRRSPEGSPSHSPGGTPLPKHVQFEEGDKRPSPEADPDRSGSDDGYSNADVRPATPPGVAGSNGDAVGVSPAASRDRKPMKIKMEGGGQTGSWSDDVRLKCCCGFGWSMVGAVALSAGILLVVYLTDFWKDATHPNQRLLLYFGVGCCIFGVLTLLVGFGFWTWTCIVWGSSGQETDGERQVTDHDTGSSRKTKYVINSERVTLGPVIAMPEEHVTPEQKEDPPKTPKDSTVDETFLV